MALASTFPFPALQLRASCSCGKSPWRGAARRPANAPHRRGRARQCPPRRRRRRARRRVPAVTLHGGAAPQHGGQLHSSPRCGGTQLSAVAGYLSGGAGENCAVTSSHLIRAWAPARWWSCCWTRYSPCPSLRMHWHPNSMSTFTMFRCSFRIVSYMSKC